ncbi:hypothetical protein E3N88_35530 [Mikania micrantha]|uniref:Reverse transcriptase domain-containing protein n=1 Tax=Mikania micrantha TaxID=192012 RepID=A0A5N6M164_9ASTR|nr:hypothetical protein E3N88_35530 [Mikania micrantha]
MFILSNTNFLCFNLLFLSLQSQSSPTTTTWRRVPSNPNSSASSSLCYKHRSHCVNGDSIRPDRRKIEEMDAVDAAAKLRSKFFSLLSSRRSAKGTCLALEVAGLLAYDGAVQTFKLEGAIQGIPISLLVDSGATHNFVSSKLTSALAIPFEGIVGINIRLGDGHVVLIVHSETMDGVVCSNWALCFSLNALVFDTGDLDLILGMEWLQSLGEVTHDWKHVWMKFMYLDMPVTLQGVLLTQPQAAALQQWLALDDDTRTLLEIWTTQEVPPLSHASFAHLILTQQSQLRILLTNYAALFLTPSVAVRPYRYPHIQKNEIERQVQELLTLGMIRPSNSAYSSPVNLVRKKDNSWRMCVDYRALNKATIPDKFPVPVVEELLDELYGASFFSKLDLKSGYNQIRMKEDSIQKTAFRTHEGIMSI